MLWSAPNFASCSFDAQQVNPRSRQLQESPAASATAMNGSKEQQTSIWLFLYQFLPVAHSKPNAFGQNPISGVLETRWILNWPLLFPSFYCIYYCKDWVQKPRFARNASIFQGSIRYCINCTKMWNWLVWSSSGKISMKQLDAWMELEWIVRKK